MQTQEECQKRIDELQNVCPQCGGQISPIETKDNGRNPTFWSGCLSCSIFTPGTKKYIYEIAARMVDEREIATFSHLSRPEGTAPDSEREHWRHAQIGGAVPIVGTVLKFYNEQQEQTEREEYKRLKRKFEEEVS